MRQSISVPIHSYKLRSHPASSAQLVNCYAEVLPPDAKTRVLLTRAPGVYGQFEPGTGAVRGMHAAFEKMQVVVGTTLHYQASDGTVANIGTVSGGPVSMAHNIDTHVVVTAPNAYYSDGQTPLSLTQITDPDFTALGARWVAFIDNYMVFVAADGSRFFWADVGTVTDYDALSFAIPEGSPDDIVGMIANQRTLVLFGKESTELWVTTESGFERAINGFIEVGCFNGDTVARLGDSVAWVANDYTVRILAGATAQVISTPAISQFLSTVDIESGRAYSYSQDGHVFYVLSFTEGCKVYDLTTGEWADRQSWDLDYYRWQFHCVVYGKQYVGDVDSGKIGYFDPFVYDEWTDVQRVQFDTQPVYADGMLAIHHRLEVILEPGVGLVSGQGFDPEIMLAYSDDGGITFTNLPNRKLGKMGEYQTRVHWDGLGSSRMRVYRFAVSDPVRLAITDIILTATGARS